MILALLTLYILKMQDEQLIIVLPHPISGLLSLPWFHMYPFRQENNESETYLHSPSPPSSPFGAGHITGGTGMGAQQAKLRTEDTATAEAAQRR